MFVPTYWPDFDRAALEGAIAEYRRRERRFGGLVAQTDRDHARPSQRSQRVAALRAEAAPAISTLRTLSAAVLAPIVLVLTYADGWLLLRSAQPPPAVSWWEWMHLIADRARAARVSRCSWPTLLSAFALTVRAGLARRWSAIAAGAVLTGALGARSLGAAIRNGGLWAAGGVVYARGLLSGAAGAAAPRPAMGFHGAAVPVRNSFGRLTFSPSSAAGLWAVRCSAEREPEQDLGGGDRGSCRGLPLPSRLPMRAASAPRRRPASWGFCFRSWRKPGTCSNRRSSGASAPRTLSRLIPGHGGLMDRLDGFLVAAFAALLIGIARQGMDAPARGFLLW